MKTKKDMMVPLFQNLVYFGFLHVTSRLPGCGCFCCWNSCNAICNCFLISMRATIFCGIVVNTVMFFPLIIEIQKTYVFDLKYYYLMDDFWSMNNYMIFWNLWLSAYALIIYNFYKLLRQRKLMSTIYKVYSFCTHLVF